MPRGTVAVDQGCEQRLCARLKPLRELAGFSQAALARRTGIPQPTISRMEAGTVVTVPLSYAVALSEALGVSLVKMTGEGEVRIVTIG